MSSEWNFRVYPLAGIKETRALPLHCDCNSTSAASRLQSLSTVNKMMKFIGGCVLLILITIPAFGATSAPSKRSPPHCEHLKQDKDVDLCYHAVVDNDGPAYCDHECHTVLQEFTRCAGNSTWSQRDQQIKALDESCVLGQTDGAATAQGAIPLALAVIGTLAAVIN